MVRLGSFSGLSKVKMGSFGSNCTFCQGNLTAKDAKIAKEEKHSDSTPFILQKSLGYVKLIVSFV